MEGMGFVIIAMMFLCVVIPLSLAIGVVLSFGGVPLIYRLKGVPKEKRRVGCGLKIALSLVFAVVTGVLITLTCVLFATYGRTWMSSPADLFKQATDVTVPQGVSIIDSEDSPGFSVRVWLHFTGTPEDVGGILASDKYAETTNFSFDFSSFKPPSWWRPKDAGEGVRYFECEDTLQDEPQWRKCMFVNVQSNQVFFLKFWYF